MTSNDVAVEGCNYSWSVPTGLSFTANGNTCTVVYTTTGTYTITCTAQKSLEEIDKTESVTTTVANGNAPVFTSCEEELIVTIKYTGSTNYYNPDVVISTLDWGDNSPLVTTGVAVGLDHTYPSSGIYTMTATGVNGCSTSKTISIAGATKFPCTVTSPHNTYTGGGFQGANDGRENVNDLNAIISVTDYDGNEYPVVQIGSQCWMAENLRCTHSPSTGAYIVNPQCFDPNSSYASKSSVSKAAHWYMNDNVTHAPMKFGLLYNWCAAVDTFKSGYSELANNNITDAFECSITGTRRGVCPKGWHIPTGAEFTVMETVVNGGEITGSGANRGSHAGKLSKGCSWHTEAGTTNDSPGNYKFEARNASGFSALPAGWLRGNTNNSSSFEQKGFDTNFWGCDQFRRIEWSKQGVFDGMDVQYAGYSVRCVRDE